MSIQRRRKQTRTPNTFYVLIFSAYNIFTLTDLLIICHVHIISLYEHGTPNVLLFKENLLFRFMSSHCFMWFHEPDFAIKTFLFSTLIKYVSPVLPHVSTYDSVDKRIFPKRLSRIRHNIPITQFQLSTIRCQEQMPG